MDSVRRRKQQWNDTTISLRGAIATPLVDVPALFTPWNGQAWLKCEAWQPTGSAKERSAQGMLDAASNAGQLPENATVVESSSGNLGVAIARQCLLRGLNFVAVVDDRTNALTLRMLRLFGARIEQVYVASGEDRLGARLARVRELLARTPGAVNLDQYSNPENPRGHANGTMLEIVTALGGEPPTHVYAAASTGGTLLGCQQAIEANGWNTEIVAVDAEGSVLFGGISGSRTLPGLGAGVESAHARKLRPSAVRRVSERDMVRGCRLLVQREGLLAGASTGAVIAAVCADLPRLASRARVVMLMHDIGTAYLDTVYDDDWVQRQYSLKPAELEKIAPNSFGVNAGDADG